MRTPSKPCSICGLSPCADSAGCNFTRIQRMVKAKEKPPKPASRMTRAEMERATIESCNRRLNPSREGWSKEQHEQYYRDRYGDPKSPEDEAKRRKAFSG